MSQNTITHTRRVASPLYCYCLYFAVVIAIMWVPQETNGCLLGMNRDLARSQLLSLLAQNPDLLGGQGLGMGMGMGMGNRMPGMQGMNGMGGMGGAPGMNGMNGMNGMGGMPGMNGMGGMGGVPGMNGMGGMGGQQGGFTG